VVVLIGPYCLRTLFIGVEYLLATALRVEEKKLFLFSSPPHPAGPLPPTYKKNPSLPSLSSKGMKSLV